MDQTKRVEWEIKNGTGIITLNTPPENYLYEPEFIPLETLRHWLSDPSLKGILIHGKGRHFSAGGNLNRMFEVFSSRSRIEKEMEAGKAVLQSLVASTLPLVAAIQGTCFGGGLEIALTCHIRVATENALFAFPETSHGLLPGLGGTVRLPQLIGPAQAAKMILSGDLLNSEEALKLRLIDYRVPNNEAFSFSYKLIQKMTGDIRTDVIRSVMKTLYNASALTEQEALREETRLFCDLALKEARRRFTKSG